MEQSSIEAIVLAIGTTSLGAMLGALGNKLVHANSRSNIRWAFYMVGFISFVMGIIYPITFKDVQLLNVYTIISCLSGLALIVITWIYLVKKSIYTTSELNPIINNFTEDSDRHEIKLFGGDLNFFGEFPEQMNDNVQYNHLKSMKFNKVSIVCEEPINNSTKIRYGKILEEIKGADLKFYNPEEADLYIRGRLKTVQGVERLMIYTKIRSKQYQAIETDTANSDGALYRNIWKLIWSLGKDISATEKQECIDKYKERLDLSH